MSFNVGQVIYLLTKKELKVYPALICEEIQKKSLTGKSVDYIVRLPTSDMREVSLEKLDTEIFTSISLAREEMISKASKKIDAILQSAEDASKVFSDFIEKDMGEISEDSIENIEDEALGFATVDLGDGQTARINLNEVNKLGEESSE